MDFAVGSLVRARGREWVVLPESEREQDVLWLRPLGGTDDEIAGLYRPLEPVEPAVFRAPDPERELGNHRSLALLRDALRLGFRSGAGPFRCFARLGVEPRPYQLVPLLLALRQDIVRLLIADDVGIGKTVEALLIARELLDRAEIQRIAVLCPPHLADGWVQAMRDQFHLDAVPVLSGTAARLERTLGHGESLFDRHPFVVVSMDFIKSERRRAEFIRACPELVIVDEAHGCSAASGGRAAQQRHAMLKKLAADPGRHLLLVTATPHSGNEENFRSLLTLLDPDFADLPLDLTGEQKWRERLARHLVQRRRVDIRAYLDADTPFPDRLSTEQSYEMSPAYRGFLDRVIGWCRERIYDPALDERRQRVQWWSALALLRALSSSPRAAAATLRARARSSDAESVAEVDEIGRRAILDQDEVELDGSDATPGSQTEIDTNHPEHRRLLELARDADRLEGKEDRKATEAVRHIRALLEQKNLPIVFCRFLATVDYLGETLRKALGADVHVECITGALHPEERARRIEAMSEHPRRVLVCTDCLSEGINLQGGFDTVFHYDLSWNPTRHEQREGRVDRFGQSSPVVRATLLYGANNPVDGAVLHVILRKAEAIRRELGVPVPLPDSGHALSQALMKAVLLRERKAPLQTSFDFMALQASKALDSAWRDAAEKAKQNRTIFAQRRLRPADVLPEWHRTLAAIGGQDDVHRFVDRALARLGSALEPMKKGWKAPLGPLPAELRERLEHAGLQGTLSLDFAHPPRGRCRTVNRSHPLVSVLAESLLERTLASTPEGAGDPSVLGRAGCWVTSAVATRTTVALLRVRHRLTTVRGPRRTDLVVEEAAALAWSGADPAVTAEGEEALRLLLLAPEGDPPPHVQARVIDQALALVAARSRDLDALAEGRALALEADHARVRESARDRGRHAVEALLPPDVIGLYVLLPRVA